MKKEKRIKLMATIFVIVISAIAIASIVSPTVRYGLHEAFNYVFWSAIGLIPIALFFLVPSPEKDRRDRSWRTIDWEMEQERQREREEEEEWMKSHK